MRLVHVYFLPNIFLSIQYALAASNQQCKLRGTGSAQNPGIVLRVTTNGIDNFKRVMTTIMNKEIPQFHLPLLKSGSFFGTSYQVTDLQIDSFLPPTQLYLDWVTNSQTQLRLRGEGLSVQLSAYLSTSSILLQSQTLVFTLDNIGFTVGFSIGLDQWRRAQMQISECEFHHGAIDVRKQDLVGSRLLSSILNSIIEGRLKKFFHSKVCDILQTESASSLSQWITQIPAELSLFQTAQPRRQRRASKRFHNFQPGKLASNLLDLASKLYLDMHIKNVPIVGQAGTTKFLDIPLNGQVGIRNSPKVPFHPPVMPYVHGNQYHHFYILVSDFTINSLLYQMYSNGLMNVIVEGSQSPPEISDFLQSSCDGDVCVGTLLPSAFKNMKRQFLQMRVYPSTCPSVTISSKNGILVNMDVNVEFYSQPPHRKLLHSAKFQSRGQLNLVSKLEAITGSYKVLELKMQPAGSKGSGVMNFVMEIVQTAIEVKIDELLQPGLKIPPLGVGRFKNLMLKTEEHVISMGVNIILNTTGLQSTVHNMIQGRIAGANSVDPSYSYDYY